MKESRVIGALCTTFMSLVSISSYAALMGATVDVDFYFPDQSTFYCDNGNEIVGTGIEYPSSCGGFDEVSIDIAALPVGIIWIDFFVPPQLNISFC